MSNSTMRETPAHETAPHARPQVVVATLALAGIVAALMQTLVVPLIGDLPRLLDASPSSTTWVITVTLLAAAVATPVAGRLGDMYGKKRLILACTVPLVLGSVVCALSSCSARSSTSQSPPARRRRSDLPAAQPRRPSPRTPACCLTRARGR